MTWSYTGFDALTSEQLLHTYYENVSTFLVWNYNI